LRSLLAAAISIPQRPKLQRHTAATMSRCALSRSATPHCSNRQREIQKRDEEWQRKKMADGSGTRSGPCYAARLGVGVAVTVVWEKTG
ncbi:Hypothetical predicted protein, partial [Olea europaea subsp. europaea]